jgi:hypothetical protein
MAADDQIRVDAFSDHGAVMIFGRLLIFHVREDDRSWVAWKPERLRRRGDEITGKSFLAGRRDSGWPSHSSSGGFRYGVVEREREAMRSEDAEMGSFSDDLVDGQERGEEVVTK